MAWILGTALIVAAALIAALGTYCLRLERQRAFWAAESGRAWLRCLYYQAEINDLRCMLAESEKKEDL